MFLPKLSSPALSAPVRRYSAKEHLAAAKKAYRDDKSLMEVAVLEEGTKEVRIYSTKHFFSKKKDFQFQRR